MKNYLLLLLAKIKSESLSFILIPLKLDTDQARKMSGLIWIQIDCKNYIQIILADKESAYWTTGVILRLIASHFINMHTHIWA